MDTHLTPFHWPHAYKSLSIHDHDKLFLTLNIITNILIPIPVIRFLVDLEYSKTENAAGKILNSVTGSSLVLANFI